jgi:hypothetical protein
MTTMRTSLTRACLAALAAGAWLAGASGCSLFRTAPAGGEEEEAPPAGGIGALREDFDPRAVVEARIEASGADAEGDQRLLEPLSTVELGEHGDGDEAERELESPARAVNTVAPESDGDDAEQKTALARNPPRRNRVQEAERTFLDSAVDGVLEGGVLVALAALITLVLHAMRTHPTGSAVVLSGVATAMACAALVTALAR